MNPRDLRAVKLGAGAVIAMVLAFRLLPMSISATRHALEQVALQRATLNRARRDLGDLPRLEDSVRVLTRRLAALAPRVLGGTTAAAGQSELAGVVTHLAIINHARIERLDPVPDSAQAGDLARLTVDAVFETDIAGITGLLASLDSMPLAVGAEHLEISSSDPLGESRGPEALRLEARLNAWYLVRRAP